MAKKKMGGLGKGLDLLFADLPETSSDDAAASTLPLREIEPDPAQPRKQFDDDALNQLADSITENGLLQPIAVRPKKLGTGYIIIAGERRWRAARLAGLDEVPVIIKDVSDEQAAALALIENLQREDLNPIEVAEGCHQLIEKYGLTQETAAKKLAKPAKPPKPKPDPFSRPKRAVEIEAALKEVTGSEVHVEYKDGKGSLKIDFYSDEMLQKFADLLGHYDPEAE